MDVFDRLTAAPRLRERVIAVDNSSTDPDVRRRVAATLAGELADTAARTPEHTMPTTGSR